VITRSFLVSKRTLSQISMNFKPAAWHPILGEAPITPNSYTDLDKRPIPRPDRRACPDVPTQAMQILHSSFRDSFPPLAKAVTTSSSPCPPPAAVGRPHPEAPAPRQHRSPNFISSLLGWSTPPSRACVTACSWSTTAGPCSNSLTAPAADRCISPAVSRNPRPVTSSD
jgi:hypothetical protein